MRSGRVLLNTAALLHVGMARPGPTGNLLPDAFLAAIAMEHGCEFVSDDRGFARFPGLRFSRPGEG